MVLVEESRGSVKLIIKEKHQLERSEPHDHNKFYHRIVLPCR